MAKTFTLTSLRGGLDDTSPPIALADDACVLAENVEFVDSTLGERRLGCEAIDLPEDVSGDADLDATTWMYRHLPENDEGEAELWVLTQSLTTGDYILTRRQKAAWETIVPDDVIDVSDGQGHRISAQTLHGKLFIAYKSDEDRLHVWDGTSLRRAGMGEPDAPTAADEGSGTLDKTRYYRVRYIYKDGDDILRRSEPSESLAITPSGSGESIRVTKPATISENESHWELEASLDDVNFYRIATTAVATTTYDDSVAGSVGYAVDFELSDDIGDYSLIPSGKFLSADQDRLIIAGSYEDPEQASRVRWTPVNAAPGYGNDERLESDTDPYLDLDGFEGGEITGLSRAVNGYLFAFKRSHIYKLVRRGQRTVAYDAIPLTKARGALPGSLVEAVNQAGQPSQYFADPAIGPCRISAEGIQWVARDIQTFWRRVNTNAAVPIHGVYYSDKRQLHYWVAVDGSEYPNAKIILHVNEMRDSDEGARRGWATVAKDNRIATAHCSVMFASNIDTTDPRELNLVPFIGKHRWSVGENTIRDYVQQCDTGNTDAHTEGDTDSVYYAKVRSKPFALAGILNQHGVLAGALLAKASDEPDGLVFVKAVRDFGIEEKVASATLLAQGDEGHVIRQLDNLNFTELYTLQVEMGDLDDNVTPPEEWELHRLELKISEGTKA